MTDLDDYRARVVAKLKAAAAKPTQAATHDLAECPCPPCTRRREDNDEDDE